MKLTKAKLTTILRWYHNFLLENVGDDLKNYGTQNIQVAFGNEEQDLYFNELYICENDLDSELKRQCEEKQFQSWLTDFVDNDDDFNDIWQGVDYE